MSVTIEVCRNGHNFPKKVMEPFAAVRYVTENFMAWDGRVVLNDKTVQKVSCGTMSQSNGITSHGEEKAMLPLHTSAYIWCVAKHGSHFADQTHRIVATMGTKYRNVILSAAIAMAALGGNRVYSVMKATALAVLELPVDYFDFLDQVEDKNCRAEQLITMADLIYAGEDSDEVKLAVTPLDSGIKSILIHHSNHLNRKDCDECQDS